MYGAYDVGYGHARSCSVDFVHSPLCTGVLDATLPFTLAVCLWVKTSGPQLPDTEIVGTCAVRQWALLPVSFYCVTSLRWVTDLCDPRLLFACV